MAIHLRSSANPRRPSSATRASVRATFVGALVILVVLTGVVAATLVVHYSDDRDAAIADLAAGSRADARVEQQLAQDQLATLQALTATDALRSGDPVRIAGLLGRANPAANGLTGGLAWIDATGTLRALSDDANPEPVSFADRDWFAAAMRGEAFVGKAVRSRVRDGAPAVTFAVPIGAGDNPTGVLAGGVLLDRSGSILTALGEPRPGRLIVDRGGQVIIRGGTPGTALTRAAPDSWPAAQASARRVGSGVRAGVTDAIGRTSRVVAWESVPAAGWTTMRSASEATLFAAARRTLARSLVITGILFALVAALIWWAYRTLQRRSDAHATRAQRQDALAHAMSLVGIAETRSLVARAVVDAALPALGARGGGVSLCDEDATHLLTLHRRGYDPDAESRPRWNRYPINKFSPSGIAVLDRSPVYVRDSELAHRFRAIAPALRSAGDKAWATAPLMDGRSVLGVLVASFTHERALDDETRLEFELLAERTAAALVRAGRHEQEHLAALAFQRSLLGGTIDTIEGIDVDAVYHPGDAAFGVGGDWYDAVRIDDHRLLVMVGDVVGRGVQAAAAMGQLRAAARALAATAAPGELLDAISALAANSPTTLATSMCCVLVDTASFVVEYAHAGHPPVAAVHTDGTVTLLEPTQRPLLGIASGITPTRRMALPGIETLVLYSDGLIERRGESLEVCLERLATVLAEGHLSAEDIVDRCGATDASHDDTVVMCVDVTEATARYHDLFDALAPGAPNGSDALAEVESGKVGEAGEVASGEPADAAGLRGATGTPVGSSLH